MNERAAVTPAKWLPGWTTVASLPSAVLRVGRAARIGVLAGPHGGLERGAKRAMDIILSTLALIVLSPLLAAVAAALYLEAPDRLIVREKRLGPGSRPIEVCKFRSVRIESCDAAGEHGTQLRLTPVGRVLHQLSLDELPQLVDVLRGEMSLVGPRSHPLRMRVGEQYCFDAVERCSAGQFVKSGITGWAQIQGAGSVVDTIGKARRRVDLDLWYLEHRSIWLDVQIIAWTALNGFRPESLD